MRTKTVIFILLSAFIFMMAEPTIPFSKLSGKSGDAEDSTAVSDTAAGRGMAVLAAADSLAVDSVEGSSEPDTTKMDSLTLAIYEHNKQVDDSIRTA